MNIPQLIITLIVLFASNSAYAYKEPTHQDMSSSAVEISDLSVDQTLLTGFGLQPFSSKQKFTSPDNPNGEKFTIERLVRDGAEFEDNFPRSLNHFFNPVDNTPLIFLGKEAGNTSPDWALEDNGDVDPDISGEQEYSYKKANDYFFKALTEATEEAREENWGKLFQTLGQVIHHVQDMGQPQHVRNDEHLIDPSWYEEYSNKQKGEAYFIELMSGNAYPIPEFDTAREFWTTPGKEGIADFTNQNFVSNDTNFNIKDNALSTNALFDLPAPRLTRNQETLTNLLNDGGITCQDLLDTGPIDLPANADCIVEFIETDVTDNKNPTYNNVNMRAASLSLYDEYLDKYNISGMQIAPEENHLIDIDEVPTLNRFNYDAAHQYLIPRAVAYSAGLINHFFKAKFEVTVNRIEKKFVIKNLSGSVMHGQFRLHVEAIDTGDRVLNQTWDISDYAAGGLGDDAEISILAPDLTTYGNRLVFTFSGELGDEFDFDYAYGYQVDLKFGTGGYFSRVVKREPRGVGLPDNGIVEYSISTYSYRNLKLSQFETNIMFDNELAPPNPPFPRWAINKFTVNNFYTPISANSSSYCIVEAIGTWSGLVATAFDSDIHNTFGSAIRYDNPTPFGVEIGDAVGLDIPGVAECVLAPYGYRSEVWSNGWISKYSGSILSVADLRFRIKSGAGSSPNEVQLDHRYRVLDQGNCRNAVIQDVNNSWPETSAPNDDSTHAFASQSEFLAADPLMYLDTYIPQNILDFSCQ